MAVEVQDFTHNHCPSMWGLLLSPGHLVLSPHSGAFCFPLCTYTKSWLCVLQQDPMCQADTVFQHSCSLLTFTRSAKTEKNLCGTVSSWEHIRDIIIIVIIIVIKRVHLWCVEKWRDNYNCSKGALVVGES